MTPSAALKRLGLAAGADVAAIRKAYAQRFKAMDVDADPEGYARLRQARDVALRAAKTASAPPPSDTAALADESAEQPEQAVPWLYGAPAIPVAVDPELPLLIAGKVPLLERVAPAPQPIEAPPIAEAARRALRGPPQIAPADPKRADVGLLARPDQDLARLLHAGPAAPEPLADSEEAFALRCLKVLLAEAGASDLARQGLLEDWLADLLAETWPRSAPLLRSVAEAFGWENERGQISERRSIAWLNARLRGLRFQEKVAERDHPLHKAWSELSRPGRSTIIDRLRVKRTQVNQLIEGVRKHFPELEQHFAPERVASWEGVGGRTGSRIFGPINLFGTGLTFNFSYAFVVIIGLNVLRAVIEGVSGSGPPPNQLLDPPVLTAPADPHYARVLNAAVTETFGKGITIFWLREKQASLASEFEARVRASRAQGRGEPGVVADAVEFMRLRVLLDGRNADAEFLIDTMAVRLAQLDAASKEGPEFCAKIVKMQDTQELTVPDAVRAQEQGLAARMADAGLLTTPKPPTVTRANIPGALIGQVIDATGLSEDRVRQAIQNGGIPADQCKVTRALLRAALKWRGQEQLPLLRVL